jgi:HAMP domain-containing protein
MSLLFAEAPALPLNAAGPYVAAAYIVFVLILLIYLGIMARRLMRNSRELRELRTQLEARERTGAHLHEADDSVEPEEVQLP